MSNRKNFHWNKKDIFGFLILATVILIFTGVNSFAQGYSNLKIYPENVGVFVTTGKQQFVAFGVTETGKKVNITDKVVWASSNESLVTIYAGGLATIEPKVTRGQVKITCSIPETKQNAFTSLTIVNVEGRTYGGKLTSVDVTQWSTDYSATGIKTGNWPSIPGLPVLGSPATSSEITLPSSIWYEVYLYDVRISPKGQTWSTIPYATPWAGFPSTGGLNSMVANVYSIDGGKNFWVHSWDYLGPIVHAKYGEGTWDDCWIGVMVHSFCDFDPEFCNGRFRSNLYFSANNGDPNCWGVKIMNQ